MVKLRDRKLLICNAKGRRIGESHPRAKLSEDDVAQILALRELGLTFAAIAGKFDDLPGGLTRWTVRDICSGRIRAQLAEKWVKVK